MSPEDAAQAAAVHAAAFSGGGSGRPWPAAEVAGFLDIRGSFALTAPGDGPLQALLLGRVIGPEAELVTLAVHPRARRAGLARGLVERFAARARAEGARDAFLEVAEGNTAARGLYASAGWREAGRRGGYYDGGREDALVLTLRLSK